MPILILLAFIGVPIVEIAILIEVGGAIGVWLTLGLVIATAVFGTWMLRLQGLSTLGRAQASLNRGQFPAREVFDGLCLVFAGALLLTPGFVTDAVGLVLLAPPARAMLRERAMSWLRAHGRVDMSGLHRPPGGDRGPGGTVIDGEFEEIDPEPPKPGEQGSSPWSPPKQ